MSNELIILDDVKTLSDVYRNDTVEDMICKIEEMARNRVFDLTTDKGKKECISFAFQIAKTKTTFVKAGKDMTLAAREEVKRINGKTNIVEERLSALRDEIRKPITELENKEKERKATLENRIADIENLKPVFGVNTDIVSINAQLEKLEEAYIFEWEEYKMKAQGTYESVKNQLNTALEMAKKLEQAEREKAEADKKAEEDRIEKEKQDAIIAAKAQAEREAEERRIKDAAEAQAKLDAEKKAREDAENIAKQAQLDKEQSDKDAAERAERAKKAEEARIEKEKIEKEQFEKDDILAKQLLDDINKISRVFVIPNDCKDFRKSLTQIEIKATTEIKTPSLCKMITSNISSQIDFVIAHEIRIEKEQKQLANEEYIKSKKTETYKCIQEFGDIPPVMLRDIVNAIYDGKITNVKVEI